MFGINPSDLPWWGWILCGLGFAVFGWIAGKRGEESDSEFLGLIVSILLYMMAAVCAVIGIARFVKWNWTGMF
jgi:hypothetical protein